MQSQVVFDLGSVELLVELILQLLEGIQAFTLKGTDCSVALQCLLNESDYVLWS